MAYGIEGSPDLATWTPLTSLTNLNLTDGVQWTDPDAVSQSARFYRATQAGFTHPQALASTQWLDQNLGNPAVRIVDARYPQSASGFTSGHIPGAAMVDPAQDLLDQTQLPIAYVPSLDQFQALMRRLGISNSSTVVVYDTDGGLWCARLWWALRYYGHQNVKLLDGGLKQWRLESRPLENEITSPAPSTFLAQVRPEWRATMTEVQDAIGRTDVQIVDARLNSDYTAGHIPSAKNVPAPSNLDPHSGALLEQPKLASLYQEAGLKPENRVITSCGGGYYGALDLFALYQLGYENVSLYDGSWLEWTSRGGTIENAP
ncbi:MAG: sulfurtransferase, partial [Proteobacteria bacterium]|nr:sulfurtransferase [Pseudomonadota bacterium]